MRYENQEKLKKAARDKRELECNIMKEYCLAESFEEFMLNCAVKYGWGPKNLFNKYWWHYNITDVGKEKFFARLLIAGMCIGVGCVALSVLSLNKDSPLSIGFLLLSLTLSMILPFSIYGWLSDLYVDFDYRLQKAKEGVNGSCCDLCSIAATLSSCVI